MTYNPNNNSLTIHEIFQGLEKILKSARRHPNTRQGVISVICNLLRSAAQNKYQERAASNLEEIANELNPILSKLTREELNEIVKTITQVYLNQRENLQDEDGNKGENTIEVKGRIYPIWVNEDRPLTTIEEIIFSWLEDSNNPIAQQVAMQAKVEFANELDKAEDEQIQEIRNRKGSFNTGLTAVQFVESRSFFPYKIVGRLATIGKTPYRPVVSNVLPEAFHQDNSQPEIVDFVLRKWREAQDETIPNTNLQIATTSHRLGIGLWLAKSRLFWMLPSGLLALVALASAAKYIIDKPTIVGTEPFSADTEPPCLPPQEPSRGIFVLPDGKIKDIDSAHFDMGQLTVEFSNGAIVNDRLWIHHQGNKPGQIGICKNNVTYGGEVIGKVEGGDKDKPLKVTFNNQSDSKAATALLQNIQAANDSQTPVNGNRELKIQISDGQDKGKSKILEKIIDINAKNQPPIIDSPGENTIKENNKIPIKGISLSESSNQKITVSLSVKHGILTIKPRKAQKLTGNNSPSVQSAAKGVKDKNNKSTKQCATKKLAGKNNQSNKCDAPKGIIIKHNQSKTVVLVGTVAEINNLLADPDAIIYQPEKNFSDEDSLTVTVNDLAKLSLILTRKT